MEQGRWKLSEKILYYLNFITVEPTLYLYMLAFMTTSVLENAFFIDKACRVNRGFNSSVCDNLTADENKELNKQVQITVSNFNLKNDIAGHVGQIVLALFMGAWSDKRGRKMPLLIGLVGKLYYSLMIIVNAQQPTWPVEYVVYTATIPTSLSGADVIIFAAAITYLVDVSSPDNRTLRCTLLEVIYLSTMPTGIALGSYLFSKVTHRSYSIMFGINAAMMVASIVYTFFRLKWRSSPKQQPLPRGQSYILDFFDYHHLTTTLGALFKRRQGKKRAYLLLLIVMMGLYTFQRDEKNTAYLYLQLVFKWSFEQISNFRTFQSALQDVALITVIPFLSKVLGWKDTIIVMLGVIAHTVARIFFITATSNSVFYAGAVFAGFGPIVAPVIRSIVSKLVAASEKGKIFSVLSVADNAIPIISGIAYNKLYNATIHSEPHSFFYLTMGTQLGVLIAVMFIHFTARTPKDLLHEEREDEIEEKNQENVEPDEIFG